MDDLFLLEAHQVAELPVRAPSRELAAVLHADPRVRRFFAARHPPIEGYLTRLLAEHDPVADDELPDAETALLWEIADWIVYQRAPERYDERSDFDPGLTAITDVVDLDGKVVIDAGAGTGRMAIAAAPTARHVFAVEPVATLRRYMRDRAAQLRIDNLFVLDGLLSADPPPVGVRRRPPHPPGDRLEPSRGARRDRAGPRNPSGIALHLVGPLDPPPPGDRLHQQLLAAGYQPGTYHEGSAVKRKFWKRFVTEPS